MIAVASPALFSAAYYQNPFPTLEWLRENDPVHEFAFPVGGVRTWFVTRYDDVRTVLADRRFSAEGATWGNAEFRAAGLVAAEGTLLERGIAVVDPPRHTRLRRLAMGAFTTRRVEQWRATVVHVAQEVGDQCTRAGAFDVMDDYAGEIAARVLGKILGFPIDRHRELVSALNAAFPSDPALIDEAPAAFGRICEYAADLVADKQRQPAGDVTTAMIAARDEGDRLDTDELIGLVAALIMGGSDTVRGFIGNAALALLDHPDQADALRRAPPEATGRAIEELLRFDGPLTTALFRVATEDVDIGGNRVPAGAPVIAAVTAANRDSSRFTDPDRLVLNRDEGAHVGFGHGLHSCLGAALARLEGQVAIPALLRRFPDLTLVVPRDSLQFIDNWAIRRLQSLPVSAAPGGDRG